MDKKEPIKVNLSTAIVLCIIAIGIAVFTTVMILNNKSIISQKEKSADDTNQKISSTEKRIDEVKENINIDENQISNTNMEETKENVSLDFENEIEKEQEDDQISKNDFSFMSEFKNTVYQSKREENNYLYRIEFDKNANPTIIVEYISKNGSKIVETYKDFSNVKSDGAAGKVYVTFDYKKTDDAKSEENGEIIYSHVTDNESIGLKLSTTNGEEVDLYKER